MAHGKHKPKQEEEAGEGAPLWIISFADMMSLLMAFFVMLSTFSGFGPSAAEKLQGAVKATLRANYGGWHTRHSRLALGSQAPAAGQLEKGSEKPTLQRAQGHNLLKETAAGDFRKQKIFVIESSKVFWGKGTSLAPSGRDFLDTLASFADKMPDRLVISESGPGNEAASAAGLRRALAVLNYLTSKGVSQGRCSIAAQGMSPERGGTQRRVEIVLLGRSVYE